MKFEIRGVHLIIVPIFITRNPGKSVRANLSSISFADLTIREICNLNS